MSKTEWKEYKLGEITDSCLGKMLDAKKNRGIPQPYLANVNVRWGSFDLDDLPLMRFEESENERYGLKFGDIVVCEGGEPGRCAIWKDQVPNMKIQKALHRVRCHENVDYRFLYYYLLWAGKKGLFDQYCTGSTIKHLPGGKLKILPIRIPPLAEQQRIAKILSSLDDKIELNNAINRNLEEQAQAIFKSWFVDFESFGGKMPEDWKLGKLGDVAEIKKKAFHPEKNPGLIVEHYSLPALDEKYYPVFEVADGIKSNKFVVSKESVLISKLNPDTKRIWRPYCISENPICSTEFVVFESINGSHRDFLYSIIDSRQFYDFMGSLVTGCTNSHQRVSPETLLTFPIAIPPKTILKSFCDKITPIYEMFEKNVLENQRLTSLRDALLPKLMSKESTKN